MNHRFPRKKNRLKENRERMENAARVLEIRRADLEIAARKTAGVAQLMRIASPRTDVKVFARRM